MQENEIFSAGAEDYAKLITLWESSVRATHHFLSEKDIQTYRSLILNGYLDQLQLYCIKNKQEILGFIGIKGEFIQMLFIHPNARGKGMGKALIDFVRKRHGSNTVDVNEQNRQAVGFYKKLGFSLTGRSTKDAAGKLFPVLSMSIKA